MKKLLNTLSKNLSCKYKLQDYRFSLAFIVILISVLGIFIVGSAKEEFQMKQLLGVLIGIAAMIIISLVDYRWVLKFYWPMYFLNLILLIAVLIAGTEVNGATRWLDLGFIQFQPSDLTKILTILFYAQFLTKKRDMINDMKTIVQGVLLIIPTLILVFKQPNLSTTICLALLFCVLMYMGGLSYKFIGTVLAIIVPTVAILFIILIQPNQPFIHQYQQNRILAWLNPEEYESEEAYQQLNSIMAIGSGKLSGKGYDSDATDSVKNGNFISEPQTDFIFAIVGEELGFIGCCSVIILLLFIVIKCIMIGMKAKDLAGKIICSGVAALIGIQSFINISVATMIFPNTGISLPFISYGLTSIVCFFMGIGFVLNVGLQAHRH